MEGNDLTLSKSTLERLPNSKMQSILDKYASSAARHMAKEIDDAIVEELLASEWMSDPCPEHVAAFGSPFENGPTCGDWDGVIPDPYEEIDKVAGREFVEFVVMPFFQDLLINIDNANSYADMRFQMSCDECSYGVCNVTYGFELCHCHTGAKERKDGWYVSKDIHGL